MHNNSLDNAELLKSLRATLGEFAEGKVPDSLPDGLADILPELERLRLYNSEVSRFALEISNGNLSTKIGQKGKLAGSLKNLHAGLRHLVWQTQAIAKGDFSQRIDFMGDFSLSFNAMVQDLQDARAHLIETNRELSQTNEALKKANAMRDKMFSIIGHDLRNPIGGGASLLEMLANEPCPFDEEGKHAALVSLRDSMKSAHQLLENLLSWARNQVGEVACNPEHVDLDHIVADIVHLMSSVASAKQISLAQNLPNGLAVYADRNMLDTVLRNLVGNAIKFTPKDGRITIEGSMNNDGFIRLCVADTGMGISPENIGRLFKDTTFTTYGTNNEKGGGLGLNICREFVVRNGGTIGVESVLGRGSRFFFTLPAPKS